MDAGSSGINRLALEYGNLEQEVRLRIDRLCRPHCAACRSICCRSIFCRESLDSPFLRLVIRGRRPLARWSRFNGWMGPEGCRLSVGRPPVCYSFFCRSIAAALPDEAALRALEQLCNLMSAVGRNALGSRHLVEVDDLVRIRTDRVLRRIAIGRNRLAALDPVLAAAGARPCRVGGAFQDGGDSLPRRPSS